MHLRELIGDSFDISAIPYSELKGNMERPRGGWGICFRNGDRYVIRETDESIYRMEFDHQIKRIKIELQAQRVAFRDYMYHLTGVNFPSKN